MWHIDHFHEAAFDLGLKSLDMFPELVAELLEAGIDPQLRLNGLLKIALEEEQVEVLRDGLAVQGELGRGVTWLDPDEIRDREPEISPEVLGGVFSPAEGHLNGKRYVDSLVLAASRLGATFLEAVEVDSLVTDGDKVTGIRTPDETYHAEHTVLAAGPWTGIPGRWVPQTLPVLPTKGQRILLRQTGFMPRCPVANFVSGYVIPQVDGNLLVAATRHPGEFDERTTGDAIVTLVDSAAATFPALRQATFVGTVAAVRPGTATDIPIIGPVPGWEALSVASRHGHVGIMLSPGTGEMMAQYIESGDPGPLEPFAFS